MKRYFQLAAITIFAVPMLLLGSKASAWCDGYGCYDNSFDPGYSLADLQVNPCMTFDRFCPYNSRWDPCELRCEGGDKSKYSFFGQEIESRHHHHHND